MKTRPILIASLALNIAAFVYIEHRIEPAWIASALPISEQAIALPKLPMPAVDNRILLLGDSHLAIHPWAEYSPLPFSNRAASGSRIQDVHIEEIEGNPALVVVSTSTNDLQARKTFDGIEEVKISLKKLFSKLTTKWPQSRIVYIAPPYPNVILYEKFVRASHPNINRPMPEQIDAIRNFVASLGICTLQAESANIDGLHIDPESAKVIAKQIERIFADDHRCYVPPISSR